MENLLTQTKTSNNHRTDKTIEVKIDDSFDKLAPMQPQWDQLVESTGSEIFMTYDWCRIWWKYYGTNRNLKILTFYNDSTPVGIIPIFFEKIWLGPVFLRAAKIVGTDFTISTVSLPIQRKFLDEIIRKFSQLLINNYHWDVLHIGPISGIYKDFDRLSQLCREQAPPSYHIANRNSNVQTYFILQDDNGKPTAIPSKKQKRIIKQKYNALHESLDGDNTKINSSFTTIDNFQNIFDEFINMHQKHWHQLGQAGHFGDWPNARQFHRELAREQLKHNRLRLLEVKANQYTLGYKYAYKFADKYVEFLDARSGETKFARAGLGNIIFCEQLEKARQEKARYIDSLPGQYEHKLRMGGKLLPVNNTFIYAKKLWANVRVQIFRSLAWLLDICYYKIWFSRIAPKLPFKRRNLWKIWIRSHVFA